MKKLLSTLVLCGALSIATTALAIGPYARIIEGGAGIVGVGAGSFRQLLIESNTPITHLVVNIAYPDGHIHHVYGFWAGPTLAAIAVQAGCAYEYTFYPPGNNATVELFCLPPGLPAQFIATPLFYWNSGGVSSGFETSVLTGIANDLGATFVGGPQGTLQVQ